MPAKKMTGSIRAQRYEVNKNTVAAHMHDPEVAPHLFKKWVGDRVAMVRVRPCDNPNCTQRGEFRAQDLGRTPQDKLRVEEFTADRVLGA